MNTAEVAISARLGKRVGELLVGTVSKAFDLNALSSLTIVCGISSAFVHRTVVPTGTVIVAGEKLKLSILTVVSDPDSPSAGRNVSSPGSANP